jgi:hypothetical protein
MNNLYRRHSIVASYQVSESTNICRITTCNERCINRVHLTFSLYTNCQNRPCGKEFNTTAFVNLLICNVNVNIILPHGRFWQFVYKENVRCTRLMQRSLQVVIQQMFVLCSLKIEAQWSEPMSFTFHSALNIAL